MTQTLKVRSIVAVVLAPLLLAIGALVLVADDEPSLQKLSVGGQAGTAERSAGDASTGSAASSALAGPMFAPSNYVLAGQLPDLPERAPAYRYPREDGAAAASRVARALGLDGQPQKRDSTWEVTDGDLTLVMNENPGLSWFLSECFASPEADTRGGGDHDGISVGCVGVAQATVVPPSDQDAPGTTGDVPGTFPSCPPKVLPDGSAADCGSGSSGAGPISPREPVRPVGLPDQRAAEGIARSALDRLGVASEGLKVEDGFSSWYAWAPMRQGGLEVLASTSIVIGVDGRITGGNGTAGTPERLGDYPLVPVAVGFERLRQGQFVGAGHARDLGSDTALPVPATSVPSAAPFPELTAEQAEAMKRAEAGLCARDDANCSSSSGAGIGRAEDPAMICLEPECVSTLPAPVPEPLLPLEPYVPPTIEVTGAHLVLVQVDGTLVPAYVFEVGMEFGGVTPPVPAVIDDLLIDFAG